MKLPLTDHFGKSWQTFSQEWKSMRRSFSVPAVHDFRVAIRRIISELEITAAVIGDKEADALIRQFKKSLKRCGPLRDIQVHLQRTASMDGSSLIKQFSIFLKDREKDEIRRIRRRMQERKRKALGREVRHSRNTLQGVLHQSARPAIRFAVQESLRLRFDALTAAHAAYRRTLSPEDFHSMRIQFKRFRYASESAWPVVRSATKTRIDRMQELQRIMGEIHDLDTFMSELRTWSVVQRIKNITPLKALIAPLQHECDVLVRPFAQRPDLFEEFRSGGKISVPSKLTFPSKPTRGSARAVSASLRSPEVQHLQIGHSVAAKKSGGGTS